MNWTVITVENLRAYLLLRVEQDEQKALGDDQVLPYSAPGMSLQGYAVAAAVLRRTETREGETVGVFLERLHQNLDEAMRDFLREHGADDEDNFGAGSLGTTRQRVWSLLLRWREDHPSGL